MIRHQALAERLGRLADFAIVFEAPGFGAGEVVAPALVPGIWSMPYTRYHPEVDRFVTLAYEDRWVRTNFDWGAWSTTEEARTLRDEPEALAAATADQLAKLITILVRQERFSEGALLAAFEAGLVLGIVRRAGELARTADG
jgi:hypothetical protein